MLARPPDASNLKIDSLVASSKMSEIYGYHRQFSFAISLTVAQPNSDNAPQILRIIHAVLRKNVRLWNSIKIKFPLGTNPQSSQFCLQK
jgi:hypothetical protein